MSITIKLCIPNKILPRIRVLKQQLIVVLNQIKIYSSNNKLLFISKGIILSYQKSFSECMINDGATIYALYINENEKIIENIMNSNNEIKLSSIKDFLSIDGPCNELNLTSVNKVITKSQNYDFDKDKIIIKNKSSLDFFAKLKDIRTFKRDNNRKLWNRHAKRCLENGKKNSTNINFDFTDINYIPPKEPCCDALPELLQKT